MWIHNKRLEESGTITYENDQVFDSGLKSYDSPYEITGTANFAIVKRNQFEKKGQYSARDRVDVLTIHFGYDEISGLEASGIYIEPQRTILRTNGLDYRATAVNDFGGMKRLNPIGVLETKFERIIPNVD